MNTVNGKTEGRQTRGTAAAAAALGVTRQHLREVLLRRRHSPGLIAKFERLRNSSEGARVLIKFPIPDAVAALCNFNEEFLKTVLWPLKNTAILVVFKVGPDSPVLKYPNIGEEIESELRKHQDAYLDASLYPPGEHWFIYWVKRAELAAAMTCLKTALITRGLLPTARLFEIEDHKTMQEWWPGNSGAMRILNESE